MARPIPDMDQMTAAEVATDDSIIIDDTSAGETKRINVGDLLGLPKFGWTSAGEVWVFSSWSSTTRIGIVTVPSNATTKYFNGMRVMITQATGGTKYAIVHAVSTTTLTLFFPVGTTLNNETISNPYYSPLDTPSGFNRNPDLWSLESIITTDTTLGSPVLNTWYNAGSHSLSVGVGAWKAYGKFTHGADRPGVGRTDHSVTVSTSSTTETHLRLTGGAAGINTTFTAGTSTVYDDLVFASPTTLYALIRASGGGTGLSNVFMFGSGSTTGGSRVIKVTSAYA